MLADGAEAPSRVIVGQGAEHLLAAPAARAPGARDAAAPRGVLHRMLLLLPLVWLLLLLLLLLGGLPPPGPRTVPAPRGTAKTTAAAAATARATAVTARRSSKDPSSS